MSCKSSPSSTSVLAAGEVIEAAMVKATGDEEAFCTSCYQCLFQLESHSSIYLAVPSKGVANTQIPGFQNGPIDRSRSTRPIRNPHIWGGSWKNSMSRDRGTASGNCTEVWPFCADPVKKMLGKTSITLSSLRTNSRLRAYIPMHAAELAKHARFFFLAPFQNVPAKFKVFERNMTAKIVLWQPYGWSAIAPNKRQAIFFAAPLRCVGPLYRRPFQQLI